MLSLDGKPFAIHEIDISISQASVFTVMKRHMTERHVRMGGAHLHVFVQCVLGQHSIVTAAHNCFLESLSTYSPVSISSKTDKIVTPVLDRLFGGSTPPAVILQLLKSVFHMGN